MHLTSIFSILLAITSSALADCQCGWKFRSDASSTTMTEVFTENQWTAFASDTNHVTWDVHARALWQVQSYDMSPVQAGGPYGKSAQLKNVVARPDDGGLQLWVRHDPVRSIKGQLIGMGEVATGRDDILYGSFYVSMKTTAVNGTTCAFTLYHSDTSDIDLYVNSRTQDPKSGRNSIGMMNHSPTGVASAKEYGVIFAPSQMFVEYRIDWLPGRIDFYANGTMLGSFNDNVPSKPARMHLLHWSNGNPESSSGPPPEDAAMTVQYVKAFFNSSIPRINEASQDRCSGISTCEVQGGLPSTTTKTSSARLVTTTATETAAATSPNMQCPLPHCTQESGAIRRSSLEPFIQVQGFNIKRMVSSLLITAMYGCVMQDAMEFFHIWNLGWIVWVEVLRGSQYYSAPTIAGLGCMWSLALYRSVLHLSFYWPTSAKEIEEEVRQEHANR